METTFYQQATRGCEPYAEDLRKLLNRMKAPYKKGDRIGIKLHWGERGNNSFLSPVYAREIVRWLSSQEMNPFVFDTTVLYSGGRREGPETVKTAAEHGYTEEYLGCPVVVGDGMDGRDTIDIDAGFKHFKTAQIASIINKSDGFFIFSHFTGHMGAGFGAAIKNISMGFASRAQKQRMHADVHPELDHEKCTKCGICMECCPAGAVSMANDAYPVYDLDRCIGCAQCIALCPQAALRVLWGNDKLKFQERLVETAAAVWKRIAGRTLVVNALISLSANCDCLPGRCSLFLEDLGFLGGYHPRTVDEESLTRIGKERISAIHPGIPWQRQLEYADELGFSER